MLKAYIGCKVIQAAPQENPATREPGYKVIYPDGYTSWSPAGAFESAYREISADERNLIFGVASQQEQGPEE